MFDNLAKEIKNVAKSAEFPIRLVAVDGHGGSGKTTFAKKLAEHLSAEVLHTDDFASYDDPHHWWPRVIEEVFIPIQQGDKTLSYDRGTWHEGHSPKPVVNQPVTPIMILEGVSSSRKEFRDYLSFAIWIDTPIEECLRRGIERDTKNNEAGKNVDEIQNDWELWLKNELQYVARDNPREYANVVVDGLVL